MAEYVGKAKAILTAAPDNEARQSLIDLIDYTILRKK
jgi:geranylgeranyl pyrophosphate synthase